ncbi:MAG: GNAT family N-acetyltransferase [Demequinaceae bacterium]|nr:GNAT family N-acetyltransferase [Demequinaceae bacterium]
MIIETDRLVLRPYSTSDAEDVHAYGSDPEVCRTADFGPNTWEETVAFLASVTDPANSAIDLAITLAGRVVGGISARPGDEGRYELGWVMRRDLWDQGYATEAARALVAHVLTLDGVTTISARCRPDNPASARVMEKAGLRFVTRIERDREVRGEWVDSLLYEMDVNPVGGVPA